MYACLGLSAIVFIIHGLIRHGWQEQSKRMSLPHMGLMAILNLTGAYAYAARVITSLVTFSDSDLTGGRSLKSGIQESTTLWAQVTRYFTLWSSLLVWHTWTGSYGRFDSHTQLLVLANDHYDISVTISRAFVSLRHVARLTT